MKDITISKQTEINYLVDRNEIYLDDDGVIVIGIKGRINDKTALAIQDVVLRLAGMKGQCNVILDLSCAGKPTTRARKIFAGLPGNEMIGKLAFLGESPVARVIVTFTLKVTGSKNLRYFKSKENALNWFNDQH